MSLTSSSRSGKIPLSSILNHTDDSVPGVTTALPSIARGEQRLGQYQTSRAGSIHSQSSSSPTSEYRPSSSSRVDGNTYSPTFSHDSYSDSYYKKRPSIDQQTSSLHRCGNDTSSSATTWSGTDRHSSTGSRSHIDSPHSSSSAPDNRRPRAPRPSYSEEQKFFIMYSRIIRDNTWPEIEDSFEKLFGTRTKGGLTSVYYRVRREWGLMEVLKSGPGSYAADCREVGQRAMNFSREFLGQIGYLTCG